MHPAPTIEALQQQVQKRKAYERQCDTLRRQLRDQRDEADTLRDQLEKANARIIALQSELDKPADYHDHVGTH